MMKSHGHITSLILAFVVLSFSACSKENYLLPEEGKNSSVTFRPAIGKDLSTRAIGDASGIDRLQVVVYEGSQTLSKTLSITENWEDVEREGITLTLIEGRSYKILFWADNENNSAYELTDEGKVSVNYDDYVSGGFSKMEEMDAFYGISEVTVGTQKIEDKGRVTLTRPFAQLNFADQAIQPAEGTHKAVVTFHSIPTSFDPFSGVVETTDANNVTDDIEFVFTDFPSENLTLGQVTHYYVASNYLFAPASGTTSIEATLDLQLTDGTSINKFEFKGEKAITLEKNKKTNVHGNIVQQPQDWSVWDGTIPTESTLEIDEQNRYIIDQALDIAWLSHNASHLEEGKTFVLTTDIDMASKNGLTSIQLPQGSTLDGDEHTIKGLSLDGGLLGSVVNVSVKNITIENSTIRNLNTSVTHIGVLANTLAGNAQLTNITIKNSSASTSNGAAGGIIGYVSRINKNSRTESLSVSFDNCHVMETSVEGSISEGHFVGLLRGYDNGETLTFKDNCSLTLPQTATVESDFLSLYTEGNEGAWLATNNYSKFNGWLGKEECYRGTVMYGNNRFIPCWDGTTKITPLTDGTTKLIHSAFDLASLQGTAAGNIKLMENIDMEHDLDGASKDGIRTHIFKALSTLTKLEGNGKTIYNITIRDNYYGGFVKSESCATTFENVTFDGADIRVTHDTSEGNAYVGTLRGFAYAATTINNVHVRNGYLNGVCKIGGLCGGIFSQITCSNSSVTNYNIENYDSQIVSAGFKANGEIGGLIGYITVLDANTVNEISNCTVSDNNFNCVTYDATLWDRSVVPFIGDIRTQQAGTVKINNCTISGTNTYTNASNGKTTSFDQHKKQTGGSWLRPTYTYYPLVGQCYNVVILDKKGKVYIDDIQIN